MSNKRRKTSARPLHAPKLGSVTSRSVLSQQQQADREQLRNRIIWGCVIAGAVVWIAWPEEETGVTLTSREECATVTQVDRAQCEAAYDEALRDHDRLAPRFDSQYQCDQQFGSCVQAVDSAAYWVPPMAGFLLGYRKRDDDRGGGYAGGYRYTGALPLYRERGGDFLNPNGDYVRTGTGKVTGTAGSTHAPARAVTISRAGFGSSSSARASFGGGRGS